MNKYRIEYIFRGVIRNTRYYESHALENAVCAFRIEFPDRETYVLDSVTKI